MIHKYSKKSNWWGGGFLVCAVTLFTTMYTELNFESRIPDHLYMYLVIITMVSILLAIICLANSARYYFLAKGRHPAWGLLAFLCFPYIIPGVIAMALVKDRTIMSWHYKDGEQSIGPLSYNEITIQIIQGGIQSKTLVWREGAKKWGPANRYFGRLFREIQPKDIPPPFPGQDVNKMTVAPSASKEPFEHTAEAYPRWYQKPASLRKVWLWSAILVGIGTPLSFFYIGVPILIAGSVLQYMLLYRWWEAIQDGAVRTSQRKAVGYCFIPFFNFYWWYEAFVGLAKDTNQYCRERSIPFRIDEKMALAYFILLLCSIIPGVGIGTVIVGIILGKQFTEATIAIVTYSQASGTVILSSEN